MITPLELRFKTSHLFLSIFLLTMCIAVSCKETKTEPEQVPEPEADPVIEIVTEVMEFQVQDSMQSGWQTFHYINKSKDPHFFLLEKYPEGKTISDGRKELVPPFQKGMNLINEGKMDEAMEAFGELPEWFSQIAFVGGSGLISPGHTAVNTLRMDPGYYVIECYVKMENGVFHSGMGMLEDFVVVEDSVKFSPQEPDVSVSISKEGGIVIQDPIAVGSQVFAVHFIDQAPHENFVGHDVNLVRVEDGADLEQLAAWMNWSDPKGLITPAPEGFTFLGGVNEMPGGMTGYFTAQLSPGNYVLISEVPSPMEKNMLKTFSVSGESTD